MIVSKITRYTTGERDDRGYPSRKYISYLEHNKLSFNAGF
jgi:hypothetical protein